MHNITQMLDFANLFWFISENKISSHNTSSHKVYVGFSADEAHIAAEYGSQMNNILLSSCGTEGGGCGGYEATYVKTDD